MTGQRILWSDWFKQYGVKVYDRNGFGFFICSEASLDSLYTDKDHGMDNLDYIEAKAELRRKAPLS